MEAEVLIGRSIRAKSLLGIFLFTTLKSRNAKLDLDSHIDPHRAGSGSPKYYCDSKALPSKGPFYIAYKLQSFLSCFLVKFGVRAGHLVKVAVQVGMVVA